MTIVYFSKTNNTKRLIRKLDQHIYPQILGNSNLIVEDDIILLTYTSGLGQIPKEVEIFCNNNLSRIKYVIASGNRNFGKLFAASGEQIEQRFGAKLIYKYELSGTQNDLYNINVLLEKINSNNLN